MFLWLWSLLRADSPAALLCSAPLIPSRETGRDGSAMDAASSHSASLRIPRTHSALAPIACASALLSAATSRVVVGGAAARSLGAAAAAAPAGPASPLLRRLLDFGSRASILGNKSALESQRSLSPGLDGSGRRESIRSGRGCSGALSSCTRLPPPPSSRDHRRSTHPALLPRLAPAPPPTATHGTATPNRHAHADTTTAADRCACDPIRWPVVLRRDSPSALVASRRIG